jgi:hypothetical protein
MNQRFILMLMESNWTANRIYEAVSLDPGEPLDDMMPYEQAVFARRREEFEYVSLLRVHPVDGSPITRLYARNIVNAATLALEGFAWNPGTVGGRSHPVMNKDQCKKLADKVRSVDGGVDKRDFVKMIAEQVMEDLDDPEMDRAWQGVGMIKKDIDSGTFTVGRTYVHDFVQDYDLKLQRGEAIEAARYEFATKALVKRWFDKMESLFGLVGNDPRRIYNCDEVMLATTPSKRKVVTGLNQKLFRRRTKKMPHFTELQCINAAGEGMRPMVVVPGLSQASCDKEYERLMNDGRVYVKSSATGWVTTGLFGWWLDRFREHIEEKRAANPSLRAADGTGLPVILTYDNAPSHAPLEALQRCRDANIIITTFPPHMTHLMQPIDVSWARSFKSIFSDNFTTNDDQRLPQSFRFLGLDYAKASEAQKLRVKMVISVIDAANSATTFTLCSYAFAKCGLCPFNAMKLLTHDHVRDTQQDPELEQQARHPGTLHMGSSVMTDSEWLDTAIAPNRTAEAAAEERATRVQARREKATVVRRAKKATGLDTNGRITLGAVGHVDLAEVADDDALEARLAEGDPAGSARRRRRHPGGDRRAEHVQPPRRGSRGGGSDVPPADRSQVRDAARGSSWRRAARWTTDAAASAAASRPPAWSSVNLNVDHSTLCRMAWSHPPFKIVPLTARVSLRGRLSIRIEFRDSTAGAVEKSPRKRSTGETADLRLKRHYSIGAPPFLLVQTGNIA